MIKIKINEPQPLPCPKCGTMEGYQYSDNITLNYDSIHGPDGRYDMGAYSDHVKVNNRGVTVVCPNCNTKLPFKLIRSASEDVS